MVPETFGDLGYYRAASLAEYMAQPLVHGGRNSCAGCHEKQQATHDAGKHRTVPCETCHGPLADHVTDGKKSADMPTDPTRRLCDYCHEYLRARPQKPLKFPQVVGQEHLVAVGALEPGEPLPPRACAVVCHLPHRPDVER
jgi:formate-dependent nitrite reductase cytochrome c552 subunit